MLENCRQILDILNKCDLVRLGIQTPDCPLILPIEFGVESENDSLILWFHFTPEEIDLLKQNHRVGFQADHSYNFREENEGKICTMSFESVSGVGNISIINDNDGKLRCLKAIMRHYVPGDDGFSFSEAELNEACVLRLDVAQAAVKRSRTIAV